MIGDRTVNINCGLLGVHCSGMVAAGGDYGDIRGGYLQMVNDMHAVQAQMEAEGASEEQIARALVQLRNAAKVAARAAMDPGDVAALEARNMAVYNDPIGLSTDYLYAKYGSWRAVIDAAYRTNPQIDASFGFGSGQPPAVDPDPDPPIDPLP
jgi:hypothetical protein